jgi:hypothetical protein
MSDKVISLPELSIGDINGNVKTSGLEIAGKVTSVTVNNSWQALPATALADRNAMSIQHQGGNDVYLGYTGAGPASGVLLIFGSERFYNITDSIVIYARTQNGTASIVVEELS